MTQVATFVPSKYQQAVFDWVQYGKGHAVIKAVPGSGKSTTLIQASKLLKTDKAVFLAFNKSIEVELNEKLQAEGSSMKAQTINSFGYSALRATGNKYKIDGNKYHAICKAYLESQLIEGYNAYEYKRLQKFKKLVSLVRMTLTNVQDEQALWELVEHYDLEFDRLFDKEEWAVIWQGVQAVLATGEQLAKAPYFHIDFDDQVYLPIIWKLTPEKKDWIFIDECQDLNAARLELIIRSVNGTGRMLFVGDECQSIYGFSGADTQSINKIIERTGATVLPLSICYRCPASHIDLCASIFPGLEARPNAPQGTIEHISTEKLYELVKPGDLVLCRLNAPLVSTCLELIRNGIRAKVRGSDIGANFVSTIKKLQKTYPRLSIRNFTDYLNSYRDQQAVLIGTGDDADMKIAALDDRVDTMKALHTAYCSEHTDMAEWSLDGFYSYIENFFSDERGPLVVLSTVHKAKGLEEKRVFILKPETMPHPKAKPGWQYEQELNIKYVAFSRSKDALYFVDGGRVVVEETQESPETVIEAPQVVETTVDTAPTKQAVKKGRKALDEADKRVVFQQMWDANLKNFFNAQAEEKGLSASELLEELLLSHPTFGPAFQASEDGKAYADRQQRAEERREKAYKGRKRTKKADEGPEDDGPNGGGWFAASNEPEREEKPAQPITFTQWLDGIAETATRLLDEPKRIKRVAYTCLRPRCKKSWLVDYYVDASGELYRYDESGKLIYQFQDFPACPHCKNNRAFIKVRYPKMSFSPSHKCDSRCRNAKPGSDCYCSCGGVNHGLGESGANIIGQLLLEEKKGKQP